MSRNTIKQLSEEEKKELEQLKARLAELEPSTEKEEKRGSKLPQRATIPLDEYIPVMSLLPHRLNLSTKEGGNGDIKRFTRFGEIKNIIYKDLVDIIEVNRRFMELGFCYIMNPDVIRLHGLEEFYSKILTKEKIEEILESTSDIEKCVNLYNSANEEQQEIIISLFIEKIKYNPDKINLNVVDRLTRISGVPILSKAQESKALEEERIESNK